MGARLVARDVGLSYGPSRDSAMPVLDLDDFCAEAGELVGATGPSGSGKTSLLYVLAGLERPQRGVVLWDGIDILSLTEADRDHWRRRTLGFVFQDFHLFSGLSALDNVLLPATFEHAVIPGWLRRRARELLSDVRMREDRTPVERLSRGEMQRVALARALLFAPPVVMADEPTASLDAESATLVGGLLVAMAREAGSTALVVVHLSDVPQEACGNFVVWPGSHLVLRRHFEQHGHQLLERGMPALRSISATRWLVSASVTGTPRPLACCICSLSSTIWRRICAERRCCMSGVSCIAALRTANVTR